MKKILPITAALALLLNACMVGPKYKTPAAPIPAAFKEAPPASFKEGDGWKAAQPGDQTIRGNWWEMFGDPQLNTVEQQLTIGNQDLKAAEARFRQARAMIRFNRAAQFPTISTAPSIGAERVSSNRPFFTTAPGASGDFLLPFDLSYEVDFWGRVRRTVNAAREEAQATAADLETASLSLHAELAGDYFELRRADAQQQFLNPPGGQYADMVKLTKYLLNGGAAPESDLIQAQTQLDTARVQDTDIGVMRAQYEHAIAILIGKPPAEFALAPGPLNLEPPVIPVGVPLQ